MEQKGPKREDRIVFYVQGKDEGNSWFDILQMLAMILSFNAVFFKVRFRNAQNVLTNLEQVLLLD